MGRKDNTRTVIALKNNEPVQLLNYAGTKDARAALTVTVEYKKDEPFLTLEGPDRGIYIGGKTRYEAGLDYERKKKMSDVREELAEIQKSTHPIEDFSILSA